MKKIDIWEMWEAMREISQKKKQSNAKSSLEILKEKGIEYKVMNEYLNHYRVRDWDIWLSTGKFIHLKTKETGRGVFNLIKKINRN